MKHTQQNSKRIQFIMIQVLTLVRIPLAILVGSLLVTYKRFLLQSGHTFFHPPLSMLTLIGACLIILITIEITDLLDGRCARRFGLVSEWGGMIDPYSDSISRIIIYWSLAQAGLAMPLVALAMACRDLTVAYCRVILAKHGQSVSAKWSGKIKAVFQGCGAIVLLLGPLYWPITGEWTITAGSWIIIGVTFASLVEYLKVAFSTAVAGDKSS